LLALVLEIFNKLLQEKQSCIFAQTLPTPVVGDFGTYPKRISFLALLLELKFARNMHCTFPTCNGRAHEAA
jgi:hypothetical protein